mmetsp:Transcript_42454/g.104042  ORF Transcript_42454/g.104042 Transcript_42454/m.104042 type:complete len:206 (+) Transcript_42454:181-798(+)
MLSHSPLTCSQISLTPAMAPTPVSPHTSTLLTGQRTLTPQSSRVSTWPLVTGWLHMAVFIAGATTMRLQSDGRGHARATHVARLSHRPHASLARVLADKGAKRSTSAHLRSSMCCTGSPFSFQIPHSSSSVHTRTPRLLSSWHSKKNAALLVVTTCTLAKERSPLTSSTALMVATLPVSASSTFGFSPPATCARASSVPPLSLSV